MLFLKWQIYVNIIKHLENFLVLLLAITVTSLEITVWLSIKNI